MKRYEAIILRLTKDPSEDPAEISTFISDHEDSGQVEVVYDLNELGKVISARVLCIDSNIDLNTLEELIDIVDSLVFLRNAPTIYTKTDGSKTFINPDPQTNP